MQNDRLKFKKFAIILDSETTETLNRFRYWMNSRRYSENTIKTYLDGLRVFFVFYKNRRPEEITNDDLIRFNNEYIIANKFSASYQSQIINAIKLYYGRIQKKELAVEDIIRPKKPKKLPNVLSKEEVGLIISGQKNMKHRTMLSLIYACGLRRGELLNLKLEDVDSKRNLLIIRDAKGMKDRVIPISDKLINSMREYYKLYRPVTWLFEGQTGGEQYSETSLQNVFKHALKKGRIKKMATLHWLRHSYATHLLEQGTDLRYIQVLLGHKSSRTTEIYTYVSTRSIQKIKSPFDDLGI
jgi:integrase/recombinase XerD